MRGERWGTHASGHAVQIRSFHVENFKSLASLDLELGRVNVLIGENGCGKSNVLEAIAFTSAGLNQKLDHEYLASRGIRATDARFMLSAFEESQPGSINVDVGRGASVAEQFVFKRMTQPTGESWDIDHLIAVHKLERLRNLAAQVLDASKSRDDATSRLAEFLELVALMKTEGLESLAEFLIYSPENSALRTFQAEGQILPLGIRGEGLFALLKTLNNSPEGRAALALIARELELIDWFRAIDLSGDLAPGERTLRIGDRYLAESLLFDQRSANEGFLFLLFYFALCISPGTPRFFAIDNVDASLNPKLCEELTRRLVRLAKEHDKQIILTTHNPAVLDGLDLGDDEQRLLVVNRNRKGHTKVRRIEKPTVAEGATPVRLSEAFLRGYLGGLPKNF